MIKQISIVYKDLPGSPFSKVIQVYYRSFLGIRVSEFYSSYSAAERAPIKIFHRDDYSNRTIWFTE